MYAKAISSDTTTPSSKKTSAGIEPQVADRLLELLGTDDVFRRLFKNDPRQALQKVGFVESASELSPAGCLDVEKLASKEEILRSRVELRTMLTSGLMQSPIQLNVPAGARHLRK